jgi:hypothetical protein
MLLIIVGRGLPGATHLLNDILMPPLDTASAIGGQIRLVYYRAVTPGFDRMIRDRHDSDLSLDG